MKKSMSPFSNPAKSAGPPRLKSTALSPCPDKLILKFLII